MRRQAAALKARHSETEADERREIADDTPTRLLPTNMNEVFPTWLTVQRGRSGARFLRGLAEDLSAIKAARGRAGRVALSIPAALVPM
jgi:hypothetical protein